MTCCLNRVDRPLMPNLLALPPTVGASKKHSPRGLSVWVESGFALWYKCIIMLNLLALLQRHQLSNFQLKVLRHTGNSYPQAAGAQSCILVIKHSTPERCITCIHCMLRWSTESTGCSCCKETRLHAQVWTKIGRCQRKIEEGVRKAHRGTWSDHCVMEENQRLRCEAW